MGYHIVYGVESGEPIDGPHLASGGGWLAWGEWVLGLDDYTECHSLAENGSSGELLDLKAELADLFRNEDGDEDALAITKTLAEAVAARPPEADSIAVTDGTPPGEDEEEDDEED